MKNINIDFKILGKHFVGNRNLKSVIDLMRRLKRKHEATGKGLWTVYVKAYNFDVGEALEGESKSCEWVSAGRDFNGYVFYKSCDGNTIWDSKFPPKFCFECGYEIKHEPKIIKA